MTRIDSAVALVLALVTACGGGQAARPAETSTPAVTAPAAPKQPATAEEVIEASLAAQGGRDALAKMTSLRQSGTVTIVEMGAKGTVSMLAAPPRNLVVTMNIPGIGSIVQGVRDDLVWETNPMTGNRIITGKESAMMLRDSTFNADLVWKQLYPKAELQGVVEFGGMQAYKLQLTSTEGDVVTRYIAKDTLLPIGVEAVADTQMGKLPMVSTFSDHRAVDGVMYPHKMVQKAGPVTMEMALDKIEPNVTIPPTAFDVPAAIKALQKK